MDHVTAIALYMENGGTDSPFDNTKILRRELHAVLTSAYQQASRRDDVHIKEADCERGHLWMEFYDGREMTCALGDILKRVKK